MLFSKIRLKRSEKGLETCHVTDSLDILNLISTLYLSQHFLVLVKLCSLLQITCIPLVLHELFTGSIYLSIPEIRVTQCP